MTLYEWSRRSVRGKGFCLDLSGRVPDSVFRGGPYAYIRHPFYLSHMLAFVASAVALPQIPTFVICAASLALFSYMAIIDEQTMANSPLATDYVAYQRSVGRFPPRIPRKRSNTAGQPWPQIRAPNAMPTVSTTGPEIKIRRTPARSGLFARGDPAPSDRLTADEVADYNQQDASLLARYPNPGRDAPSADRATQSRTE